MAPQTNWSSVLLDPRSNYTLFVPSEAGFRAHGGEGVSLSSVEGKCAAVLLDPRSKPTVPVP